MARGAVTGLLAAALAIAPGIAHAAETPCLAPAEFSALIGYGMSSALSGTVERCAKTLPAEAFLRGPGAQTMIARYAAAKPAQWPRAKAAFLKLGNGAQTDAVGLLGAMADPTLQQLADTFVAGLVASQLPTEHCSVVDRMLALLAPLPPETTAQAVGMVIGIGARSGQARLGKIAICTP